MLRRIEPAAHRRPGIGPHSLQISRCRRSVAGPRAMRRIERQPHIFAFSVQDPSDIRRSAGRKHPTPISRISCHRRGLSVVVTSRAGDASCARAPRHGGSIFAPDPDHAVAVHEPRTCMTRSTCSARQPPATSNAPAHTHAVSDAGMPVHRAGGRAIAVRSTLPIPAQRMAVLGSSPARRNCPARMSARPLKYPARVRVLMLATCNGANAGPIR